MHISIINWDKYNKRKDIKSPWWFALNNRFLEDPDLFGFTHSELIAFIYLMCQASQKKSSYFEINFDHAAKVSNIDGDTLRMCISKLKKLRIVTTKSVRITNGSRTRHVRHPFATLHDKTLQNNTYAQKQVLRESVLTKIYEEYPRKVGKGRGLAKLKDQLKTEDDLEKCLCAVLRFKKYHIEKRTESQYIPHFSTWVSSWQDCLDDDFGYTEQAVSRAQRI